MLEKVFLHFQSIHQYAAVALALREKLQQLEILIAATLAVAKLALHQKLHGDRLPVRVVQTDQELEPLAGLVARRLVKAFAQQLMVLVRLLAVNAALLLQLVGLATGFEFDQQQFAVPQLDP